MDNTERFVSGPEDFIDPSVYHAPQALSELMVVEGLASTPINDPSARETLRKWWDVNIQLDQPIHPTIAKGLKIFGIISEEEYATVTELGENI